MPTNPTREKNSDEFLYPELFDYLFSLFYIISPFMRGKRANTILYTVWRIPKAVPVIFFFTTKEMEGTRQLL